MALVHKRALPDPMNFGILGQLDPPRSISRSPAAPDHDIQGPDEGCLSCPQLEEVRRRLGPAGLAHPRGRGGDAPGRALSGATQRGAQFQSSDTALEGLLTLRAVSPLTRRATEGLAGSLLDLRGRDLDVPDPTTLSRRAGTVPITLPKRAIGPRHLVLDSTGLKVDGQGQGKVRQPGDSPRRTWRKLHLALDPQTHEIQAAMVSDPGVTEAEMVPRGWSRWTTRWRAWPGRGRPSERRCTPPGIGGAPERSSRPGVRPRSSSRATRPAPGWLGMRTSAASAGSAGGPGRRSPGLLVARWARRRGLG
jgi:hypothetical protein